MIKANIGYQAKVGLANVGGRNFECEDLALPVPGHHQQVNASLAVAALQMLVAKGWSIDDEAIRAGLRMAKLEGRTEVLARQPMVVVDLAHNVASVLALVETLQKEFPGFAAASCRRLIFAASREKDVQGMLQGLTHVFDQICLTQFTSNPRGIPVQELEVIAAGLPDVSEVEWFAHPDPRSAWQWCQQSMEGQDFVCVTGSVFLVAELRPVILGCLKDSS